MAKGEGFGLYSPDSLENPRDLQELSAWVSRELAKLSAALQFALARNVEFLHVEPVKLREGMVVGADGTDWNPGGGGQGVYAYYNGTWNKLG